MCTTERPDPTTILTNWNVMLQSAPSGNLLARCLPKINVQRILIYVMSDFQCTGCGAPLVPEARFCRQCGAAVTGNTGNCEAESSELPTATLHITSDNVATKRLQARSTSANPGSLKVSPDSIPPNVFEPRRGFSKWIIGVVLLVMILGIASAFAFVRNQRHSRNIDSGVLIYPGSQTTVDMQSDTDRAVQLKTSDSFEKVVAWYEANLKPTKTIRLTSTSVVLRNQNVIATIASEDNKTNILIKQSINR